MKTIGFIINGEHVPVKVPDEVPFIQAVEWCLDDSFNRSRPIDQWEIRRETGERIVDLMQPVAHYPHIERVFLTLAVGAGGALVEPVELDVEGYVDARGIKYIGKAVKQFNGKWRCLAIVGQALCLVEATITFGKAS